MERKTAFHQTSFEKKDDDRKESVIEFNTEYFGNHFQSIIDSEQIEIMKSKINNVNTEQKENTEISKDFLESSFIEK